MENNDNRLLSFLMPEFASHPGIEILKLLELHITSTQSQQHLYTEETCLKFQWLLCMLLIKFQEAINKLSRLVKASSANRQDAFSLISHALSYG